MQNIFYSEDNYLEQGTCHVIDSYSYEVSINSSVPA